MDAQGLKITALGRNYQFTCYIYEREYIHCYLALQLYNTKKTYGKMGTLGELIAASPLPDRMTVICYKQSSN